MEFCPGPVRESLNLVDYGPGPVQEFNIWPAPEITVIKHHYIHLTWLYNQICVIDIGL